MAPVETPNDPTLSARERAHDELRAERLRRISNKRAKLAEAAERYRKLLDKSQEREHQLQKERGEFYRYQDKEGGFNNEIINRTQDMFMQTGLNWEFHGMRSNHNFVTLELDQTLSQSTPSHNLIIEGDNWDSLRALRLTHKGRVKCIYIDPPYNTGNKDFVYNDRYVDKDDNYRHSSWLTFMYQRLMIARDLLTRDGVIMISIGDEEQARLELLMERVMPGRKVAKFVVKVRSGANDAADNFSMDHEYVICYANPGFKFGGVIKDDAAYKNPDNDPNGPWIDGPLNTGKNVTERHNAFFPILNPATDIWYPCSPDSTWRFASEKRLPTKKVQWTIESLIRENRIIFRNDNYVKFDSEEELKNAIENGSAPIYLRITLKKKEMQERADRGELRQSIVDAIPDLSFWVGKKIGTGRPGYKRYFKELKSDTKPISSLIFKTGGAEEEKQAAKELALFANRIAAGTTADGTKEVREILPDRSFSYPKPLELVKGLIDQATRGDDQAIILDFFAGTGTTGHAVLSLNQEQATDKTFILCCNSETSEREPSKNICRDITAERIRRVISGYTSQQKSGVKEVEGLGGSFAYLRTGLLSREEALSYPIEQGDPHITKQQMWTLLLLKHGLPIGGDIADFIARDDEQMVVLMDDISEREQIVKHIRGQNVPTTVYSPRPGLIQETLRTSGIDAEVREIPHEIVQEFEKYLQGLLNIGNKSE